MLSFYPTQSHRNAENNEGKSLRGNYQAANLHQSFGFLFSKSLCLCVSVLICLLAAAQTKPRIDFDHLLKVFPDLPWDFEIRYVVHDELNTDMLRLYYDGRVDLVRWRPTDPGSLAEVCHGTVVDKSFLHLLETLRDKTFNDLPSDDEPLRAIAQNSDATISVRVGKITVRKTDRHQRDNPKLATIEDELNSIQKSIAADKKTQCGMESVPARP